MPITFLRRNTKGVDYGSSEETRECKGARNPKPRPLNLAEADEQQQEEEDSLQAQKEEVVEEAPMSEGCFGL